MIYIIITYYSRHVKIFSHLGIKDWKKSLPKRGGTGKAIWLSHAGLEGDEVFQNNSKCSKT
jgi:hypothetical protein